MTDSDRNASPADPKRLLREKLASAGALLQRQEIAAAEHLARDILEAYAGHPQALQILGLGARARGQLNEAAEYLLQAVRSAPKQAQLHANLGLILLEQGAFQEAERALDIALHLDATLHSVHYNRGNLYLQTGRASAAAREYEAVLMAEPSNAGAHANLALIFEGSGDRSRARQHLNEAARLAPTASTPWQSLARLAAGEGRLQEALAALDTALERNPEVGEPLLLRGQILQTLGRFDAGEEAFRTFLEMRPRDAFLASQALQPLRLADEFSESDWLHHTSDWRQQHFVGLAPLREPENPLEAREKDQPPLARIAFLSVAGDGPARLLPDIMAALEAQGVATSLWCSRPPQSLNSTETRIQRLDTRDPRRIAGNILAEFPDLLIQCGGLAAPELLLAALMRPAARVAVWASHPRLGYPEIDDWFVPPLLDGPSGDKRLSERPLPLPAGSLRPLGSETRTARPDADAPVVVPSAPAAISPHRLALLHQLTSVSGRPLILTHPDFELEEIHSALIARWQDLGTAAAPVVDRNPAAAAILIDTSATPDEGTLAQFTSGIPLLLLHPDADPAVSAACRHLWATLPETMEIPAPRASPEVVPGWARRIASVLANREQWESLSRNASQTEPPLLANRIAETLLATMATG